MFNKFNQKDDPLLDSVKGVIDTNQIKRQAAAVFNESLGIQDRKQLPHELLSDYDRELEDFTVKSLTEGVVNEVSLGGAAPRSGLSTKLAKFVARKGSQKMYRKREAKKAMKLAKRVGYGATDEVDIKDAKQHLRRFSRYEDGNAGDERRRADAAYKKKHGITTPFAEENQLDELSKDTLKNYVKKASHDVATKSAATGRYADRYNAYKDKTRKGDYSGDFTKSLKDDELAGKFFKKSWKRREGIAKAVDKLEENQLDEVSDKTKHSYVRAAAADVAKRGKQIGYDTADLDRRDLDKERNKRLKKNIRSVKNRETGIKRAVGKNELAYVKDFMAGAKQGMSEEQLDERKDARGNDTFYGPSLKQKKTRLKRLKAYKKSHETRETEPEEHGVEAEREMARKGQKMYESNPLSRFVHKIKAKRAGTKADRAFDDGDEAEFVKQTDNQQRHKVKSGGKMSRHYTKKALDESNPLSRFVHKIKAKRAGTKADRAFDDGDEAEFVKQTDNQQRHKVKSGGKMSRHYTKKALDETFGTYTKKDDPTGSKRGVRGGTSKGKSNFMLANKIADKLSKKADKMNAKDAPKGPVRIAEDELNEISYKLAAKALKKAKKNDNDMGMGPRDKFGDTVTDRLADRIKTKSRKKRSWANMKEEIDIDTILEEIAINLYAEYEYVCENYDDDGIQTYIDSLSDEQYEILEATAAAAAPIPKTRPADGAASPASSPPPQASSFRPAQSTAGQGVAVLKGVSQYIKDAGAGNPSTKNLEYATAASRGAATGNKVQDIGGKKIDVSKWAGGKEPAYVKAARDAAASAKPAAPSVDQAARSPTPTESAREKNLARQKGENDAGEAEMRAVARRDGVKAKVAVRGPMARGGPGGGPTDASTEANAGASVAADRQGQEQGAPPQTKAIDFNQQGFKANLERMRALESLRNRPDGRVSRNRLTKESTFTPRPSPKALVESIKRDT